MTDNLLSNNPEEDIAPISPFGAIEYPHSKDSLRAAVFACQHLTEINDSDDYEIITEAAGRLAALKQETEKTRKSLKSDALKHGKLVDSMAKELQLILEPTLTRLAKLRVLWNNRKKIEREEMERKDKIRKDKLQAVLDKVTNYPLLCLMKTSQEIMGAMKELADITGDWEEFELEILSAKQKARARLSEMYNDALANELQKAELDKLKQEQEEQKLGRFTKLFTRPEKQSVSGPEYENDYTEAPGAKVAEVTLFDEVQEIDKVLNGVQHKEEVLPGTWVYFEGKGDLPPSLVFETEHEWIETMVAETRVTPRNVSVVIRWDEGDKEQEGLF